MQPKAGGHQCQCCLRLGWEWDAHHVYEADAFAALNWALVAVQIP
jgi:hypothetical protein